MKKLKASLSLIFAFIFLISTASFYTASAACDYNGSGTGVDYNCHYLLYGVSGRYYYLDSSASTYSSNISSAISNWNSASSSVSFSNSSYSSSSPVRFLCGSVALANSPGETIHYSSTTTYNPLNSSWPNAKIILSSTMFPGMSSNSRRGTCAHEFGHALGLNHMVNTMGGIEAYWIMTPYAQRSTYTVDSVAADVIDDHLY